MIRVLLPVPEAASNERFRLDAATHAERHHYLVHVLRVREGQAVEVFDGRGHAWPARVESATAERVELSLGAPRAESMAGRRVTIVQGLPKGDKLEWVIEKAVELGAHAVLPVECARSVVKLDAQRAAKRVERWRKIAEEAARQSGRSDVPEVQDVIPLSRLATVLEEGTRVLVLDEEERTRRLSEALPDDGQIPVAFVVGPEGGLTREEVARLISEGGVPVSLGALILRTETAALAALSVVRHRDGLLG